MSGVCDALGCAVAQTRCVTTDFSHKILRVPMCFRTICAVGLCLCVLSGTWAHVDGQGVGAFRGSSDDPAIKYSTAPLNNAVAEANTKIQDGAVRLAFEGRSGFLRSAL